MSTYYCRVCWNDQGWRFPSGQKRDAGYAGEKRFGHEEWLFNLPWTIDGYHYAFLQPVNKDREKRRGESLNLLLWTINPNGTRCEVGRIKNCRVLTAEEAKDALKEHKRLGWFRQMQVDVEAAEGDKKELDYEGLFNVRFRPADTIAFDPPVPFDTLPTKIARSSRYRLMEANDADLQSLPTERKLDGTTELPPDDPGGIVREQVGATSFDRQERRLQKRLMELLQKQFGKKNVTREGGFGPAQFDLVVRDGQRTILIELKAYADARRAVREALGQILEYAFYYPKELNSLQNVDLFIVAPAAQNEAVSSYMNLLRSRLAIPVRYCSFTLGDPLPGIFVGSNGNQA
jgi:hypothetical protein